MASMTSCFNSTLYRKTMARFWPLWALYTLAWAFIFPLNLLNKYFDQLRWGGDPAVRCALDQIEDLNGGLSFGLFLALFFCMLSAMAAFGYLYTSRSTCMMHALPLRRETLFATQYLAGLSFSLLPHLAIFLLTLAVDGMILDLQTWTAALASMTVWLLVQSAFSLFFYSFAVFCAMFTGHSLALPAFYGILNFLVLGIYDLIGALAAQFMYGFTTDVTDRLLVQYCTPAYALSQAIGSGSSWTLVAGDGQIDVFLPHAPLTVAGYAAAGAVFALLALLVYRVRHAETAGDVVSVPLVRPVFRCGVALCAGLFFGVFTASFFGWIDESLPLTLCAVLWAVIGCFAAEMFLQKSFRVWKKWKWAAAMGGVMALLCAACFLDLFGVTARVPAAERVQSLSVYAYHNRNPQSSALTLNLELDDPEQMQRLIDLHQAVVNERDRTVNGPWDNAITIYLDYTLKSGSHLQRRYYSVPLYQDELDREGSVTWTVNRLFQDRNLALLQYSPAAYAGFRLTGVYLEDVYSPVDGVDSLPLERSYQELWHAVQQDLYEGSLGNTWLFEESERPEKLYATTLNFEWTRETSGGNWETKSCSIPLAPGASHTLAVLETLGFPGPDYGLTVYGEAGKVVPLR